MICPSAYEIRKSTSAHAGLPALPSKLCYQTPSTMPRRQGTARQGRSGQGKQASSRPGRIWMCAPMPCQQARDTRHQLPSPDLASDEMWPRQSKRSSHMATQIGSAWQGPCRGWRRGLVARRLRRRWLTSTASGLKLNTVNYILQLPL